VSTRRGHRPHSLIGVPSDSRPIKLALVGYGDLGRYVEDTISEFHVVDSTATAYLDDGLVAAGAPRSYPFASYSDPQFSTHTFFVCLGYKHLGRKLEVVCHLASLGRSLPSFVHPSAYVHPSVTIGHGAFVYPGCSIDRNTTIGLGTWITNADVIAHDCTIGNACWFGATVTVSGKVDVGDCTFLGSGTTVANDTHIGAFATVGMGTAITRNIPASTSAIGNPMRLLDHQLRLV
jgi:acetyltransferase EpsM